MKIELILNKIRVQVIKFFNSFSAATADTFNWLGVLVLHCATIPSLLAIKSGITDNLPPLDLVLLLWIGLLLLFMRAAILKDMLIVITIGIGFAIQALLISTIFFA